LEGDITVPGLSTSDGADDQEFNTLDEPVRETVVSISYDLFFTCEHVFMAHITSAA